MKNKILCNLRTARPDARTLAFCNKVTAVAAAIQFGMAPVMCAIDPEASLRNIIKLVFNTLLFAAGIILLGVGIFFLAKGLVSHDQGDLNKGLGFCLGGVVAAGAGALTAKVLGIASLDNLTFD